jgi:fatty acid desaturase
MSAQISWDHDRAEIRPMASCRIEIAPILVYVIGLVTMLALSAAYNMWPVLPAKWIYAASTTPRSIY